MSSQAMLLAAAGRCDLVGIRLALRSGADALVPDQKGATALMLVCSANELLSEKLACLQELLPVSDAKAQNQYGDTALIRAAFTGFAIGVETLIPVSDPRATAERGNTALRYALRKATGPWDLLVPVSDLNQADADGMNALHWAASQGNLCALRELLRLMGPDSRDGTGRTALHVAAEWNHPECVKELLLWIDPKEVNDKGRTPLMTACQLGSFESIEILLPLSDLFALDINGRCALIHACGARGLGRTGPPYDEAGVAEAMRCVMRLQPLVDAKAKSEGGRTALMWACGGSSARAALELLPVSDPLAVDEMGRTALAYALESGMQALVAPLTAAQEKASFGEQLAMGSLRLAGSRVARAL